MPTPRDLADLPYARHLRPLRGPLEREGSYDAVHVEGAVFEEADGGSARFLECAFSSVLFSGGRLRRARFNDVWQHGVRWVGTDLAETDWLDAEVAAGAFAGTEVFGATMRRVVFHQCKFQSVNARGAELRDVTFVDCLLRDVDLGGAALTGVAFPGSALDGVRLDRARLKDVDLRDATRLALTSGHDALKGATITGAQLIGLAPELARALGITVSDR
ncbi:hypothetical protein GCM10027168_48640 [Streptomyces capparidis]